MANVVRGEVQVQMGRGARASVGAAGTAPVEEVLKIAGEIWAEVQRSPAASEDEEDALLKRLQEAHKDFATSFPVPFRWMVQAREYDPGAFEKFLRGHVKMMYKDRKEFLEAQGEYLVLLFKARHPRVPPKSVEQYRGAVRKSLAKDDEAFAKAREEAEAEVERLDKAADAERRERIYQYLRRRAAPPQG